MQQHVEDHAQTPNIAFMIEDVFFNALWTLIGVEPHFFSLLLILHLAYIAETSNFDDFILEEEAGRFEPTMDVSLLSEEQEPR